MIKIPLLNTVYKDKLLIDLLENKEQLKDFHNGTNLSAIDSEFINHRDLDLKRRKTLVSSIKQQYLDANLAVPKNLDKLSKKGCFTITTGHQLCVFGGPQYFIHKIISVIKIAQGLKKRFPNNDFVPVFWLASEDHDFKEISNLNIFNNELKVEKEDSIGVGKLSPSIFEPVLNDLKVIFKNDDRFKNLNKIFSEALCKDNWSLATRYWLAKLFDVNELIIVDPDDKSLKELFASTMNDEIDNQFIHNCVKSTNNKLDNLGYNPKINPRELNLFYLSDDKRERIIFKQKSFHIGNLVFSKNELQQKLKQNPERFSPNVLLRPLYQETILPNLVYVGGPSEITYWAQLKESFDIASVNYPVVILRDHFSWITKKQIDLWVKLGFSAEDLLKNESDLVKIFLFKNHNNEFSINDEKSLLTNLESSLTNKAEKIDLSLVPSVKSMINRMNKDLNKIQQKILQSIKRGQEQKLNQIIKINNLIVEKGKLKERSQNFIAPYINSSKDYTQSLLESSNCEDNQLKILFYTS